jgi:hypothetical protein
MVHVQASGRFKLRGRAGRRKRRTMLALRSE